MTFTNVASVGFYLQCCHRTVAPGGSFSVPWESGRRDRGLRAAMNAGRLAWRPDKGEAPVPGSPPVPDFAALEKARKEKAEAKAAADAKRVAEKAARQARALSENMGRMGRYDVPTPVKREVKARTVETEKPVTSADVLREGAVPSSLEALRRHNRAASQPKVKNKA